MRSLRFASCLAIVSVGLSCVLLAQQSPTPAGNTASIDNDFVHRQFGSNCSLIGMSPITADLDGDSVEDIVIPAHCTNPMMDQAEKSYIVVDPYNSFFGYGNPTITTQFSTEDPQRRGYSLLVIHGAGPDAWRTATPKAKFMIVNLPFKEIYVKKLTVRKKDHLAIYVVETGGDAMTSALVWDGKKYRYSPMGSTME
jgi:hypothetical protein